MMQPVARHLRRACATSVIAVTLKLPSGDLTAQRAAASPGIFAPLATTPPPCVRLSLTGAERFALSAEAAWRRYPNSDVIRPVPLGAPSPSAPIFERQVFDDEWRATLNLAFAVARGKTVASALGRDFDANVADNDPIALLRFLVGFGTSRVPS